MPNTLDFTKMFHKIGVYKSHNVSLMKQLKGLKTEGHIDIAKINAFSEIITENNDKIASLRHDIVDNMRKFPMFRKDQRFRKIPKEECEKMERFYETMSSDREFILSKDNRTFEDYCKEVVNDYAGIISVEGEAFPESFTNAQKLSAIFVNKGLEKFVIDPETKEKVTVDMKNLKLCSYPADEVKNFDTKEQMGIMERKSAFALNDFYSMISLRPKVVVLTMDYVDTKIAENPEGASAMLTQQEVENITEKVMDLDVVKKSSYYENTKEETRSSIYEEVVMTSTAQAGAVGGEIMAGAELRNRYNLPPANSAEESIYVNDERYWITEEGVLSDEQLDEHYENTLQDATGDSDIYEQIFIK